MNFVMAVSLLAMLDLRRLHTFREVVARRSFSAAALALDYTQSSVSQQIAGLERDLGATLIDRGTRPVRPTPAGELVLARADALLGEADAIEQELGDLTRGTVGTLRLGGFFTAWATFLPGAVADFARVHPAVALELRQLEPGPATRAVIAGELDLAVLYRWPAEPDPEGVEVTPLLDDHYAVALPRGHALARREAIGLADLAGQRWVLPPPGHPYTTALRRMCAEQGGFQPDIAFETADIAMAQPLVAAGLAVSLLPALGLVPRHHGVTVRPLRDTAFARSVVAVRTARRRTPAALLMTEALVRAAARRSSNR